MLETTGTAARVRYFKRYKMEVDLDGVAAAELPAGYHAVAWRDDLLETHAEVLFQSFHLEIDAAVFPSLGDRAGCTSLMTAVRRRAGFVPEATWLVQGPSGACGTIQGLRDRAGVGAIQNVGVAPAERGRGLGEALVLLALRGFRAAGLGKASLEATAHNEGAMRLYRRLGFVRRKTIYKALPELRFA